MRKFIGLRASVIEFQLWDSMLHFTCPKPSFSGDPLYRQEFFIDERPFVNTKSRRKYIEFNSEHSFIDLYRTGWDITQHLFGLKKAGTLTFSLQAFYLHDEGVKTFGDLKTHKNMEVWVNNCLKTHKTRMAQLNITNANAEYFKIEPLAEEKNLLDSHKNIPLKPIGDQGGLLLFGAQPFSNTFEYYGCFSCREFLKFSFSINYKENTTQKLCRYLEQQSSSIMSAIMSSVKYMAGIKNMELS